MKRVIIESPYRGQSDLPWPLSVIARWWDCRQNIRYLRACMHDSLMRGEAPYASHGLYTQPGVLRDHVAGERAYGITAGFVWGDVGSLRAVYIDRGMRPGMKLGVERSKKIGQAIEIRSLPAWRKRTRLPTLETTGPRRSLDGTRN